MKIMLIAVVVAFMPVQAFAYCSAPYGSVSFPDTPSSFQKPSVPYCLSSYSYSGTHTCEEWEITSYKNDVDNYVSKLQDYVDESFEVVRKAARLAEEAQDYAKCEAADIARQHQ